VAHCAGIAHLLFSRGGGHYTWRKVSTTVHNIIVGRLWVDNHGEMDITNHKTGDICHLKYAPYSYFSREMPHKVNMCLHFLCDTHSVLGACKFCSDNFSEAPGSLFVGESAR